MPEFSNLHTISRDGMAAQWQCRLASGMHWTFAVYHKMDEAEVTTFIARVLRAKANGGS